MNVPRGNLISDHLHNLDLELQLLKRKRELLEQQQIITGNQHQYPVPEQRSYRFNQPQQTFSQPQQYNQPERYNQNRNFSHLYEDRPGPSNNTYGRKFGKKRPATERQDNFPPKRFNGSQRGKPRKVPNQAAKPNIGQKQQPFAGRQTHNVGQRPQHPPNEIKPVMCEPIVPSVPSARPRIRQRSNQKPTPKPLHNDFKTQKPKSSAPNNLNSRPVAERKKLVAEAAHLATTDKNFEYLLRPGENQKQITGRLELGLGMILKEMRDAYAHVEPYMSCFHSSHLLRIMKNTIRERIRDIMVGKHVPTGADVVKAYRAKYPKETDVGVMIIIDQEKDEKKLAMNLIDSDDPHEFFKANIKNLVVLRLNEMFSRIQSLYEDEIKSSNINTYNSTKSVDDNEPKETTEDSKDDSLATEEKKDINTTEGENKMDTSTTEVSKDDASTIEENTAHGSTTEINKSDTSTTPGNSGDTLTIEENKDDELTTEENKDNSQFNEKNTNEIIDLSDEKYDTEKQPQVENNVSQTNKSDAPVKNEKHYVELMEKLIKQTLPSILPRYKAQILKILDVDKVFKAKKYLLARQTREKLLKAVMGSEENYNPLPQSEKPLITPSSRHYVKILGRPALPKRNIMKNFLDLFQPKSIKKHKSVNNLLFVGFDDIEHFNNILALDGKVVGGSTLIIKISDNSTKNNKTQENQNKQIANNDNDIQIIEDRIGNVINIESTSEDSDAIGGEIDAQINNLLSSIRSAEEKSEEIVKINDDNTDVTSFVTKAGEEEASQGKPDGDSKPVTVDEPKENKVTQENVDKVDDIIAIEISENCSEEKQPEKPE